LKADVVTNSQLLARGDRSNDDADNLEMLLASTDAIGTA
jgi:hypothetical protein